MLKDNLKKDIRKEAEKFCNWAVCFDIAGCNYDDKKERTSIVATFHNPINAEDFINKALPKDTKDRFYIVGM